MIPETQEEAWADIFHRIEQLERRLENRKRTGLVTDVDAAKGVARVSIGEDPVTGEPMKSPWIAWDEMAMGAIKFHTPPSVGEQVTVESENGEWTDARIKTSVPSDANGRPSDKSDEHVRTVGNVRITERDEQVVIAVGGAVFELTPGKVKVTCGEIEHNGHVTINGDVQVNGNMIQTGVHQDARGFHK